MSPVDRRRLPVPGPSGVFRFPAIHRHTLGNGLDVRAVAHHNVPVVSAVLLVPGGTAADPADRPGLAAFTGDLLDEGCGGRSAIEVSDLLARYGADLDVDVGPDATAISLTTLTRFLRPALALLAEMTTAPDLREPDIERVRKLRLERLRQLRDHAPAVAERAFARLLYGDHPYGHLGVGSEAALTALIRDDITAFHRAAFAPAGATLAIAGDAAVDELNAAVAEAFGGWQPAPGAAPIDRDAGLSPPPPPPERRLAVVHRPGAAQSELRIGHVAASRWPRGEGGDVDRLLRLLAPDAVVTADDAAVLAGTPRRIEGRDAVATFFNGSARATLPVYVEGRPGTAWFHKGEARVAFDFLVTDGLVRAITFRAAPDVLARLVRRNVEEPPA